MVMRPYKGTKDLAAMQALLVLSPNPLEFYPSVAELPELLDPALSNTSESTAVWEAENGELLGWAIVSQYNNLHYHFAPGALTAEREQQMMVWAVERMRLRLIQQPHGESLTLDTHVRNDDVAKLALLSRHGFVPTPDETLRMVRSLHDPLPSLRLPTGFAVRPLRGESEAPAYVEVHRAAYGTEKMTLAQRLSMLRDAEYRPQIDLVITAPDGSLVAFCVCFVDPAENKRLGRNAGEIGIVGTHPAYWRRGLGRAVVLAGLHALKDEGLEVATLGVAGANRTARRVYEALGFELEFAVQWYSKRVTSAEC